MMSSINRHDQIGMAAMSEARIKARLWVQAALRQADLTGRPGMVLRHGDDDAGGIAAVLRGRDGFCVLMQTRAADGSPAWMRAGGGAGSLTQDQVDQYLTRQTSIDSDLWVVEFDSPDLTPPFEAKIL
ncbi:Hypothetical protein GbCGDNIH3_0358 [Granulibacter bethesdensis]|uniref:Uncharacterized protein n=2 Tax=Granulibacter bethesdensis TaxID=364410 RepID=A0AAN0VEZ2_9PROT|nr:Hypothetical protein GbCGDNIH3_0358 [Granulibacter bethesdensis]APH58666.1 Hypothetical protein GbCGDNIH7_0358 [Granulibacter bethesdensis]